MDPRFNLNLLRNLSSRRMDRTHSFGSFGVRLTRRSFITLSGAGAVLGAAPPFLRGDGFDLIHEGERLHIVAGDERRWSIDPAWFGDHTRIKVNRAGHEISISLQHGFFPGTYFPADLVCRLKKEAGTWIMHLKMDCGVEVSCGLLDWLNGRRVATGFWNVRTFQPFDEFSMAFESAPAVQFTTAWLFSFTASSIVSIRGLRQRLPTNGFELRLNAAPSISGFPIECSTRVVIPRQTSRWAIDMSRQSDKGWALDHDLTESIFDELHVEAANVGEATQRSALLLQLTDNESAFTFRPGGVLFNDSGEPFAMSLRNPRLAFSLDDELHSSLVADLHSEPIWAHDEDVSYLFTATADAPYFELHEGPQRENSPEISPAICEVCFPNDSSCVNLKMGVPRPVPFTWADFLAPFERFLGWLHLLPTHDENHKLIFDLASGDVLSIERPDDLLSLRFKFENMRLVTGACPRIVHIKNQAPGSVSVIFPPQHAAEEAFYHTDDPPGTDPAKKGLANQGPPVGLVELNDYGNGDPNVGNVKQLQARLDPDITSSSEGDKLQPGIKFSGPTNLAFHFPDDKYEIRCNVESLLNWADWLPAIVPVAQSAISFDRLKPSPIASPNTFETSIELPYRLMLSPSDLGRWAHRTNPVRSEESGAIELWHTRLGVKPTSTDTSAKKPSSTVDETNTKDRIARAVWSPDVDKNLVPYPSCAQGADLFPPHYSPSAPVDPDANPFRMSLDGRDRCELVHLTSNYQITQQAHWCENNQPVPSDPKLLLSPIPVQIKQLMLTSMGGYLEAFGQWNPCKVDGTHQLTVQMWEHIATLGRDHYVKVVYKGYLAPFGLRASLVKVTQRYFELSADKNWVAILHQHMYVIVKKERKQCPILGQPFGGRAFPFSYVEPVTLKTPFLSDPASQSWPQEVTKQSQSLFWPMVPDATNTPGAFNFRLRFTDVTGIHSAESSMPLLFVASDVAQADGYPNAIPSSGSNPVSQDAVYRYNRGSQTSGDDEFLCAKFSGQKFSFAASSKPGDTDFETDTIAWKAVPLPANLNLTVTGAATGAYVTIQSVTTNTTMVQTLTSPGPYTATIDSGSILVSVTTPIVGQPAAVATSAPLPVAGSASYKLDLVLADPTHFGAQPALVATGSANGTSPTDLYHYDLPFFYPAIDYTRITSTSIKRITGSSKPTKFTFYPIYLSDGFNTSTNAGEVILQKHPEDELPLRFGGANGKVDKAGGLASPDVLVVGFSRKGGPVGGKTTSEIGAAQTKAGSNPAPVSNGVNTSVSTFSSGKFDPAQFFGGLLSAKLLGAVNLSDIIAPLSSGLSNLAQAPQMIEQALYKAEGALDTAKTYIQKAVTEIAKLQTEQVLHPLAVRLAAQAQQVADANDTLNAAGSDIIAEAVAEAQVVARIADYAAALQGALKDPLSLVEDAVITELTSAAQDVISKAQAAAQAEIGLLSQALSDQLDAAIQNVVQGLTPLATAMATTVVDDITAADQAAKTAGQPIQNAISYLAPDLNNIVQIAQLVPQLNNDIKQLGASVKTALSNPATLPQIIVNASSVLTDLQMIYQNAGFLAVAVNAPTLAAFQKDRDSLLKVWHYADYIAESTDPLTVALNADLATFHDSCIKLASASQQTFAQQVLQSLNLFETAVQKAVAYRKRITDPKKPVPSSDANSFRELQLLEQMQGQMLSALAALQSAALGIPSASSADAVTNAKAITSAASSLAKRLTVASKFWDSADPQYTKIETLLFDLTGDANVAQPLTASASDLFAEITALRARIAADPADLGLQLLLYNLNIDYQRPLAAALAYVAYVQTSVNQVMVAARTSLSTYLPPILQLIAQAATALQKFFCTLSGIWINFRTTTLKNLQGPLQIKLGPIIDSLFGSDLDAIGTAFNTLCTTSQTTASEYLRNSRALIAAFVTLEKDVRAKITSLPAIEAALLQAIQGEIDTLLAALLTDIPIPTNINLSYTWNPTIQSCAPVFLLNPNADFKVKAEAQAGLDASLALTAAVDITASLTNFSVALIGDDPFITLVIDSLTFTSHNGSKPDVRLLLNTVVFGASMQFVQDLADLLDPTDGPFIELAHDSIRAGFRFAIESMTLGAFNLMQLAIEVAVALPFDGTPVRCEMGLSDQQLPFLLSCGIYGGGGFLQLQLGLDGVQLLQGAFEFGVCADISIGPLVGSGFVVAGIFFSVTADSSMVCGFVHAHGHMDIFGIISMDIDLYVGVCYDAGAVTGLATFSVSVSIGFFSESFSMQAQYTFAGSKSAPANNKSELDVPYHGAEAFLVQPDSEADLASQVDLVSFETIKPTSPKPTPHLPRPPHNTIQPGQYQQTDPLVDPTTWENYYNSFVKA